MAKQERLSNTTKGLRFKNAKNSVPHVDLKAALQASLKKINSNKSL